MAWHSTPRGTQHTQGDRRQAVQPTLPCDVLTSAVAVDRDADETRALVLAEEGRVCFHENQVAREGGK